MVMAEVLTVSQSEQSFASSLPRSSSQPSLLFDPHQPSPPSASNKTDYKSAYRLRDPRGGSTSHTSSAPSSPSLERVDFSNTASYLSTPSSILSLEDGCDSNDEEIGFSFPIYGSSQPTATIASSVNSEETVPELTRQTALQDSPSDSSEVDTPPSKLSRTSSVTLNLIADDTAVKPQPTRHVDYLSHDWKEEDIWSSWRHIVAKRGELDNWERLENASWRTWMKSQQRLRTINPDKLNWMKDHDVTWLYGPLQTGSSHIKKEDTSHRGSFSASHSFLGKKKPILKRRSVSEIMLARSLSTQSLMRQATDAIRAQEAAGNTRPTLGDRTYSDVCAGPSPVNSSNRTVPETPSPLASSTSSGSETPDDRRHIHFNETVEQCIAISSDSEEPDYEGAVLQEEDDHSSDEEFLTMKTDRTLERKLSRNATPRGSFSEQGGKTIAMLPATTLKYRADTPEPQPQKGTAPAGTSGLRASSSSETLRPSHPSANFLLDEDSEDEPMDPQWKQKPVTARKDSLKTHQSRYDGPSSPHPSQLGLDLYRDDNDELQRAGMRRTPSGMFMPYDENEMGPDGAGLYGKVVDTYNTARDIAHVIWNVGWRR